jgi:hypothetical protein
VKLDLAPELCDPFRMPGSAIRQQSDLAFGYEGTCFGN